MRLSKNVLKVPKTGINLNRTPRLYLTKNNRYLVPYSSRARTNDVLVQYETDGMFNGVMSVGFVAG